jgi:NAD(P)-dependent dehydrogenase (short-subunit alcohol dehydrogenase family)
MNRLGISGLRKFRGGSVDEIGDAVDERAAARAQCISHAIDCRTAPRPFRCTTLPLTCTIIPFGPSKISRVRSASTSPARMAHGEGRHPPPAGRRRLPHRRPNHPGEITRDEYAAALLPVQALPISWVEARDISNAVLSLVSDEARYVTGVTLPVDGGVMVK